MPPSPGALAMQAAHHAEAGAAPIAAASTASLDSERSLDLVAHLACSLCAAPASAVVRLDGDVPAVVGSAGVTLRPLNAGSRQAIDAALSASRGDTPVGGFVSLQADSGSAWGVVAAHPLHANGTLIGAILVLSPVSTEVPHTAPNASSLAELCPLAAELLVVGQRRQRGGSMQRRAEPARWPATDWLWETEATGRLTWLGSSSAVQPTSASQDLVGTPWWPRLIGAGDTLDQQGIAQAVRQRESFGGLQVCADLVRGPTWLVVSGVPVIDAVGRFVGFRGSAREVGRHSGASGAAGRAMQAPGLIEQRLQIALEISRTGVWDWDLDLGDLHVSPEMAAIMGLSPGERIAPDQWLSWIHPDDVAQVRQAAVDHLRGTTSEFSREFRIRRPDGHEPWVHARGQVVRRDADGRARRVVGAVVDVSQRRLAETLRRDKEVAELAARNKARFLRRMSHRMRTPLNAVIGFAQLLRRSSTATDPRRVAEYAQHTLGAGRQLLRLVEDVLDLQRAEDGRLVVQMAPIGVEELLPALLERVKELADQRGTRIVVAVEGHPTVVADRTHLLHALDDLVSSAIRFGRAEGIVRISVESDDHSNWHIVIEDNGPGLRAEQVQVLFEPFEPIDGDGLAFEDPGLGLLVARALIECMGGRLALSSRPGTGTRAIVTLARAEPVTVTFAESVEPHAPAEGCPLRLLHVEDNRVNALLFEEAMRTLGQVELRIAESAAEALAVIETWTPDVLVLDSHLPDRSGYELLAALRERAGLSEVPAFMCSADALAEDIERARAAGFTGYWIKPIDFAQVFAELRQLALSRARG